MRVLAVCLGLALGSAFAQDEGDAESTDAGEASQEVDVNEENYRRFMELEDRDLPRNNFPTPQVAPPTGLATMDRLPESSQRHLRNQLREIIVEGGPWTPEDAGKPYPYVPSPEAVEDGNLQRQESAAWQDLVAEYHEREAAIHEGAARSAARAKTGAGAPGDAGSEAGAGAQGHSGPSGSNGQNERQDPAEALRNNAANARQAPGGASSAERETARDIETASARALERAMRAPAPRPPEQTPRPAPPDEGVSESALEFLTGEAAPRTDADEDATAGAGATSRRGVLTVEELEAARGLGEPEAPPRRDEDDEPPP